MEEANRQGLIVVPKGGAGIPRFKRYLDEQEGIPVGDVWTDIRMAGASERLGYQTQKPLALLERIIAASSNPGDVVLDPFCGCGTAIEAAERLGRRWIGIDVTYLAIHVIESRLAKAFGPEIKNRYRLFGRPKDADDARVLAARDWLEFQKWAVLTIGGFPKDRPGPDGGIDGIIRYHRIGVEQPNRAVVSVKGGTYVGVDAVHKLKSVVARERAEMGVLICLNPPTTAMVHEALSAGEVGLRSQRVARVQIITVEKLFEAHPIDLPGTLDPPEVGRQPAQRRSRGARQRIEGQTEMLLPVPGDRTEEPSSKRVASRSIRPVEIEVTPARRTSKPK
jgi:hypothetical protein